MKKKQLFDLEAFRKKKLPTEQEIITAWRGDISKPVVSVLCNTYNHERYIEDALKGFLLQRTTFPFEVVVHDDASSDGTADLVRKYAARYPGIIKPVMQSENQYSKGRKPTLLSFPHAKGEYIALCEGDDFWVSERKLEMQYWTLQEHPKIAMSFHASYQGNTDSGKSKFTRSVLQRVTHPKGTCVVKPTTVLMGSGEYMPTPTLMFKAALLKYIPDWFAHAPVGDYFIQILGSYPNGALYLNEPFSFYRVLSLGSWTGREILPERELDHTRRMLFALDNLDKETGNQLAGRIDYIKRNVLIWFFYRRKNSKYYWREVDGTRHELNVPLYWKYVPAFVFRNIFRVRKLIGLCHVVPAVAGDE